MKILMISFHFPDYTIEITNALAKENKGQVYLAIPKNKLSKDRQAKISKKVTKVYFHKPQKDRQLSNFIHIFKLILKIKQIKPDLIHFQGENIWFLPIFFSFFKKTRIDTIHDLEPHIGESSNGKIFTAYFLRRFSQGLILHSAYLKNEMLEKLKTKAQIAIIPHGGYEGFQIFKKYKEKKNWILFFGRIFKYKGLDYLIKAEPLIRKKIKDFKIVIAGTGEDFKKYQELIKNKENFIIYNRYISEKLLSELFQKANVVVLPYIAGSQTGVIPLAYAFKKPVIATKVGALPEMVIDQKTGFLIGKEDPKQIAEAVVKMLNQNQKRQKMGQNGYLFAKKELSLEKIAKKTITFYKKC
ncbi:MAG: glycosyltransferase, partial [Candidatus Moranbacteria bacterium]|nr:glycosyltransferase [Candidatus Moranbacteria bacterium]